MYDDAIWCETHNTLSAASPGRPTHPQRKNFSEAKKKYQKGREVEAGLGTQTFWGASNPLFGVLLKQ